MKLFLSGIMSSQRPKGNNMGTIHSYMGLAVEAANDEARVLSLKRPGALIMAVVTRDKPSGKLLAWATTEQKMAEGEVEVAWWKNGVNQRTKGGGK